MVCLELQRHGAKIDTFRALPFRKTAYFSGIHRTENQKKKGIISMITKMKKSHKTTEIFFDEASDILVINTFNTSLKNRLKAYAKEYPELCRQTDDNECGGLSFEMQKDRFGFRLLPPCSEERKAKARACAEALNQSRKEL